MSWEPNQHRLAVLTDGDNGSLYLWSPLGAVVLRLPLLAGSGGPLLPQRALWNPLGKSLCMVGTEMAMCARLSKDRTIKRASEAALATVNASSDVI